MGQLGRAKSSAPVTQIVNVRFQYEADLHQRLLSSESGHSDSIAKGIANLLKLEWL